MKKFLFLTIAVLAMTTLLGAGCAWWAEDKTPTLPPEAVPEEPPMPSEMPAVNIVPEVNVNIVSDPTADWEVFRDEPWVIEMKYPSRYKTVHDTYGWPHALVHFIEDEPGRQSYRARIETWENEGDFRETYREEPAFIIEHPNGKNWVTVHYYPEDSTYPGLADEWRLIISTFRFTSTP